MSEGQTDGAGFLDANCRVGGHLKLAPGGLHTVEDVLSEMDHFGISEALVLDPLARENHPAEGNRRVLRMISGQPRLHPAWVALPAGTDEQPDPEELVESMRKNGVGALFLFPRQYRFSLAEWAIDGLLGPLSDARVPVFINYNEVGPGGPSWDETDWGAVVDLCRRWPELPVIVSEERIRRSNRLIYRALDACENLRIELSGYWLYRGVEYITRNWGARRLIFGSNWPRLGHGCTVATLTSAEISEEDQRLIAGGNMRELMSWCGVRHPKVALPDPADEFVAMGRTGRRPPRTTFADCHGHLGGYACHYHIPDGKLEDVAREMDRLGIEKACVFSFSVVFGDEQPGNDLVADAVRRFPHRFVGFTGLNPHRGPDGMLAELERCGAMGLRGIKLIPPYQGFPPEHPYIEVACRWANERRQIILNHHWGSCEQLERLLARYPEACFLTGHATVEYASLIARFPNLHVCTCGITGPRDCEGIVKAIGAERFLFGSDLLDLPIAWGLGPILFARLTPEQKRLILGGNLLRILERYSLTP
jgi:predicted TIM-barrel fold metal-dependent hydrolase